MDYRRTVLLGIITVLGLTPIGAQTHRGKASYYSKRATGSRTASGERLHHDSLTCAHRSYPFGTLLRVKNLSNGKEIIVKVTDRGPYGRGRIIDLSYGAARELGMLAQGVAMVEVHRVDGVTPPYRMNETERGLPDFEFDFTQSAYSFSEAWKENEAKDKKLTLPEHKVPAQKATQEKHAAPATNTTQQTQHADSHKATTGNTARHESSTAKHEGSTAKQENKTTKRENKTATPIKGKTNKQ